MVRYDSIDLLSFIGMMMMMMMITHEVGDECAIFNIFNYVEYPAFITQRG